MKPPCMKQAGRPELDRTTGYVVRYESGRPPVGAEARRRRRRHRTRDEACHGNRESRRRHPALPRPVRSAGLLEVVTIVRDDGSELAIHAMKMRAKYQRLLRGG